MSNIPSHIYNGLLKSCAESYPNTKSLRGKGPYLFLPLYVDLIKYDLITPLKYIGTNIQLLYGFSVDFLIFQNIVSFGVRPLFSK